MGHNSLSAYYQTNAFMVSHSQYTLTEIENLIPWEREVYLQMLIHDIQEKQK